MHNEERCSSEEEIFLLLLSLNGPRGGSLILVIFMHTCIVGMILLHEWNKRSKCVGNENVAGEAQCRRWRKARRGSSFLYKFGGSAD